MKYYKLKTPNTGFYSHYQIGRIYPEDYEPDDGASSILLLKEGGFIDRDFTEVSEAEYNEQEGIWKLPEKWCFTTTEESKEVFLRWLENNHNKWSRNRNDTSVGNHYCFEGEKFDQGWMYFAPESKNGYTEITFDQFKKYVLNKSKEMKQEIVGYLTPTELWGGRVKKGSAYVKASTTNNYALQEEEGEEGYYIPKEIVETWEPVYKPATPDITVNGYKGEFFDWGVKFGCAEIDKELFTSLYAVNEKKYGGNKTMFETVTIGKGTFTKVQIVEIANYYLNK